MGHKIDRLMVHLAEKQYQAEVKRYRRNRSRNAGRVQRAEVRRHLRKGKSGIEDVEAHVRLLGRDGAGNEIKVGDSVRVTSGPNKDLRGTVKGIAKPQHRRGLPSLGSIRLDTFGGEVRVSPHEVLVGAPVPSKRPLGTSNVAGRKPKKGQSRPNRQTQAEQRRAWERRQAGYMPWLRDD